MPLELLCPLSDFMAPTPARCLLSGLARPRRQELARPLPSVTTLSRFGMLPPFCLTMQCTDLEEAQEELLPDDAYMATYTRFRERLRRARLDARMGQAQLASLLGKPQSFVSKVESGERRLDFVELQMLVHILGKPISYFVDETLTG